MNAITPHRDLLNPERVEEIYQAITDREALKNMRKAGWRWKVKIHGPIPKDLVNEERRKIAEFRAYREMAEKGLILSKGKRAANNLAGHYVRHLIKDAVDYDGHEITEEEIEAKREFITSLRAGKVPHPNSKTKKTKEEKKARKDNYITRGRQNLEDWYVISHIRARTGLKAPQITEEMIQKKREQIQERRKNRLEWPKGTRPSKKLTDGYIMGVLRNSPGSRAVEPTPEVIAEVRERIRKKRLGQTEPENESQEKIKTKKSSSSTRTKLLTDSELNKLLNAFV